MTIILQKPPKFRDIPPFTPFTGYRVDVSWQHLEDWLAMEENKDLNPDFQRGHVWTKSKRQAYIEFCLRGGDSASNIYWNCKDYGRSSSGGSNMLILVDGKQRLTAIQLFLHDEVPVFGGHRYSEFADRLGTTGPRVHIHINGLGTRAEVLQWYLDLNTGGVVHTEKELQKVRDMLEQEKA